MSRHHPLRSCSLIVCALVVWWSCQTDDIPGPTTTDTSISALLSPEIDSKIRDLPALERNVASPEPWEGNDSLLVAALRRTGGVLWVGLRDPEFPKTHETAWLSVGDKGRRPNLQSRRGVRGALSSAAIRASLGAIQSYGATVIKYYAAFGMAIIVIPPEVGPALAEEPRVDWMDPFDGGDGRWFGTSVAHRAFYFTTQTIPWGDSLVAAPQAWTLTGGDGAEVLIIDTGLEPSHEDLPTLATSNCLEMLNNPVACSDDDSNYHGTSVAGVVYARDDTMGVVGVANALDADDIYAYKACIYLEGGASGGDGTLYMFGGVGCKADRTVNALEWAEENLSGGVVNISYGFTTDYNSIATAVASAIEADIVVVAAVGNNFTSSELDSTAYPAAYDDVVGVSGVMRDSVFASFSTSGPCPNSGSVSNSSVLISAPYWTKSTIGVDTYADSLCGTSYSAPFVAGVAALIRAANPTMARAQVVTQLTRYALDLGDAGYDEAYGWGIVQADLAVGLYQPDVTGTVETDRPKLTWSSIPMADHYKIWRQAHPEESVWTAWDTTSSTTYKDWSTKVDSLYGYTTWPPANGDAVGYYVEAIAANGKGTGLNAWATFIPQAGGPG